MGCGKSTVAAEVSRRTGLAFLDTDRMVEEALGMSVSGIFSRLGEEVFRQYEHEAILRLMTHQGFIAALGGGAVVFERNVQAIRSQGGVIVWLDTPLEIINTRLARDISRPLLDADLEKRRALYEARLPHYRAAADLRLEEGRGEDLADRIIEKFHLKT